MIKLNNLQLNLNKSKFALAHSLKIIIDQNIDIFFAQEVPVCNFKIPSWPFLSGFIHLYWNLQFLTDCDPKCLASFLLSKQTWSLLTNYIENLNLT